jgi:hypothetical protein
LFHLEKLVETAKKCGFLSVYILVDRVDETKLTGQDAGHSFKLVQALISDLQILETPGLCFKFFLWDKMKDEYTANGARPDRVKIHTLSWNANELEQMLSERLRAYSGNNVSSLNALADQNLPIDVHKLAARMGEGSPRDMIRFCGRMIDEHTRVSTSVGQISLETVYKAVRTFSIERSDELYGPHMEQLRRIAGITFTISQLASDVFHSSNEAVRQKVQAWMNAGAVKQIGGVENTGKRPRHLYAISDLRLSVAVQTKMDVDLLLSNVAMVCPSCDSICLSDRNEIVCTDCGNRTEIGGAHSLLDVCGKVT